MSKQLPVIVLAVIAVLVAMGAGFGVALLAASITNPQPPATLAVRSAEPTSTVTASASASASVALSAPTGAAVPTETPAGIVNAPEETSTPATVSDVPPGTDTPSSGQTVVTPSIEPDTDLPTAYFAEDTFDSPASGWPIQRTETWSAEYVDGQYRLTLHGRPTVGFSFPLPTLQYRLEVDVTVVDGVAGVIFLFAEPDTFYQLVIDNESRYAIQQVDGETITNVVDWTPSEALLGTADATNRLRVRREGTLVHFFANDQLLTDFVVPPGEVINRYGFVVEEQDGKGQAIFDNLIGERLLVP